MNAENRNQIIIFAVLLVVLGGVFYWSVLRPGGGGNANRGAKKGAEEASEVAQIAASVETAFIKDEINVDELIAKIQDVRFDYKAVHEARNPMRPLVGTTVLDKQAMDAMDGSAQYSDEDLIYVVSAMPFTGVVWDDEVPMGVLNNELVYVGFTFEEYGISVTDITDESIVLMVPLSDGPIEHVQRLKEPEEL